jgi:hypothetical protein
MAAVNSRHRKRSREPIRIIKPFLSRDFATGSKRRANLDNT